jgi:hypothetical protein
MAEVCAKFLATLKHGALYSKLWHHHSDFFAAEDAKKNADTTTASGSLLKKRADPVTGLDLEYPDQTPLILLTRSR